MISGLKKTLVKKVKLGLLSTLLLSSAMTCAMAASGDVVVGADLSSAFAPARLSKLNLTNKSDKDLSLIVSSTLIKVLNAGGSEKIDAPDGTEFLIEDPDAGASIVKSVALSNLNKQSSMYAKVNQQTHIIIPANGVSEYALDGFSYVEGISADAEGNLPLAAWDVNGDAIKVNLGIDVESSPSNTAYVGTPIDLAKQEALYKKYFMPESPATGADVWNDFKNQGSGVTDVKRAEEIIISLTSYPARFETTWLAIESLLRQEEKADRVVLNLFEGEFPGKELPWFIQQQMKRGLEINWCPENLKVYLKAIPTIQKFPDAAIVVFDDDVIYPNNRLKNLIAGYKEHPDCVIAQEVREVTHHGRVIYPCCEWNFTGWNGFVDERKLGPSVFLVPEGVTGVLFPSNSLSSVMNDYNLFKELTPTEDDLWLYTNLLLNKKEVVKIQSNELPNVIFDAHNMDSALSKINTANGYKVSTQSFHNLFYRLNLKELLKIENFCLDSQEARSLNFNNLSYGVFLTPRQKESPIALLDGWSWTENWIGHRGGVWTDKSIATFSLVSPVKGHAKIQFKARFVKHPIHDSIKFRIKRNGITLFRGEESKTEFFDFTLIDFFDKISQFYELVVDNPILASDCGFDDRRSLGVLIHKINIESLEESSPVLDSEDLINKFNSSLEVSFINPSQRLIKDGALKIAFDYANDQCGIDEEKLQRIFSELIHKSYDIAQNKIKLISQEIPYIHSRAWHTSINNPKEVPADILSKYINSLKLMHATNQLWQHIFWCNDKTLIPDTINRLNTECSFVEIREVDDLRDSFIGKPFYEKLMTDSRFTNANDVFRMSLMYAIGGFYMDLGFEIQKDLSSWVNSYNYIFYMYGTGSVDHNFMAMPPKNKVAQLYLKRFLNPESISKVFRERWKHESYFQQHLFCGGVGVMVDLLDSLNAKDALLLVPENNSYLKRFNMNSWHVGNDFGNTPVHLTSVDFFAPSI